MIDDEQAKELKDAGFPQKDWGKYYSSNRAIVGVPQELTPEGSVIVPATDSYLHEGLVPEGEDVVYVPTLSELIEAVKNHPMNRKDIGLYTDKGGYVAWARKTHLDEGHDGERDCFGSTPEEAVARLWLALKPRGESAQGTVA